MASQSSTSLWRNNHGKSFDRVPLPETNWVRAFGVAAIDYDNDGWVDLVAVGETKGGKGEVRLFRNLGPDGFKDVTADVGLDKIQLKDPRAIITGDYDGDGATDLLITQNHGPAVLLRNEGGNQNHWLRLSLKGLNDNKSAIGTKVEVFSGGNRQKFEICGIERISGPELHRHRGRSGRRERSRRRAHALADRRFAGRDSGCRRQATKFPRDRPPWQFLPHAVCLERRALRIRRRYAGRGRGWALDWPQPARHSASSGVDQD
jgi:hypothetical protein